MSDARMSWAKASCLVTVIDDFFDAGGSEEEHENFMLLAGKWDNNYERNSISKNVRILFSALYDTVDELGAKASSLQGRNVTDHMIEIWQRFLESGMQEAKWHREKVIPTMDEYMEVATVSFTLGPIVVATLYFVGPKLSEGAMKSPECHELYMQMSICGRLLNDIQSFKREAEQGKLNSVALLIIHSGGSILEDEAKREIQSMCDSSMKRLLGLVVREEGSVLPRACKDLFWKMNRTTYLYYRKTDGFTAPKEMVATVNAVIYEPL